MKFPDKTLAIDGRMINNSGIGVYLKNLLPFIIPEFKQVYLLGREVEIKIFDWSSDCILVPFDASLYSLKEQLLFPFKIPRVDLFWCPHFNTPLLPIKAKKKVSTIHDLYHLANKEILGFVKYQYAKILFQNAVRKSSQIITVSNFSKNEIHTYLSVNPEFINVIYCGVSKYFSKKYNNEICLPEKYILFVGNLKPHKNLITLLKAYNSLSTKIKEEYKIVVLGKEQGFLTPDNIAKNYIRENDLMENVIFTGYILDNFVPYVYKKASLFVFPSMYEGFGLPILEAMISGVPVLSSDTASLREVGGEAANYFHPTSFSSLANKITDMLTCEIMKKEYVQKGHKRVRLFSWEKSANKHLEIFSKIFV